MSIHRKVFLLFLSVLFLINHGYTKRRIDKPDIFIQAAQALKKDPEVKKALPASLSCFIIDLKFNDARKDSPLKILELGPLQVSKFKLIDNLQGKGVIWKAFWEHLSSYKLPVFAVGRYSPADVHARSTFNKIKGIHFNSLGSLKKNDYFKLLASKELHKNLNKVKNHKGIIINRGTGLSRTALNNFKRDYPGFIIVNMEVGRYAVNKERTCSLFNTPELKKYRPQFGIFSKNYTKKLSKKIINDLQCDKFVIKPLNTYCGNGVIMVSKKKLDKTLKKILKYHDPSNAKNNRYLFNPDPPQSYNYWKRDQNEDFIVEEFAESKHITIKDKHYDATMRVVVAPCFENGKVTTNIIGAYWKRPVKGVNDEGTFRQKHISKHSPTYEESIGCLVSKEDLANVEKELDKIIPEIYWNALIKYYTKYSK